MLAEHLATCRCRRPSVGQTISDAGESLFHTPINVGGFKEHWIPRSGNKTSLVFSSAFDFFYDF